MHFLRSCVGNCIILEDTNVRNDRVYGRWEGNTFKIILVYASSYSII
jgi:hypothetical protein